MISSRLSLPCLRDAIAVTGVGSIRSTGIGVTEKILAADMPDGDSSTIILLYEATGCCFPTYYYRGVPRAEDP